MKKKVALLVGYNGEGYHGLQFNKDMNTIEKEVIGILLKNDCITELNSLDAQKIDLKSSSRTDKGVHASFNVMSVKIIKEPTAELFAMLKSDFEQKGMALYKIVTLPKSFLCYKQARSRVYKYIVPTYFLQAGDFVDEWKSLEQSDFLKKNDKQMLPIEENEQNSEEERKCFFRDYSEDELKPLEGFKSDSIELFRKIIEEYAGTHNFHNFTLRRTPGDVKRHMMELKVTEPFYSEGIEFVEVKIHGQSFLLHQIRKMISFAILNCRYFRENYKKNFETVFSTEDHHVPKAPSQYLFLNHVYFDDFNMRRKQLGEESIDINEEEKKCFEEARIYPSVMKKENLYEWFKFFDTVRFHHDKFDYLA